MPHLCIVVSGEGRWRVEQHSQHIGLDVADTGSVVAQALEHILDVQAVDLLEALMDQLPADLSEYRLPVFRCSR